MAEIQPFRGIRYNPEVVGDLSAVTSPPYDVLTPEECEALRQLSPYNVIRLILGPSGDDEGNPQPYLEAGRLWRTWQEQGVLIADERPCLYLIQQEFHWDGRAHKRRGLVCLVKLHDYADGVILPHERTFPKHKRDRYRLMEATRANLDSVFGLYDEERHSISDLLAEGCRSGPVAASRNGDERNTVWRVEDAALINELTDALAHEPIVIADGHHRYETALAYRVDQFMKTGVRSVALDYVMMTLSSVRDPGVLALPTHRVVSAPAGMPLPPIITEPCAALVSSLAFCYHVDECASASHLLEALREAAEQQQRAFGVYLGPRSCLLVRTRSSAPTDPAEDMDVLREDILDRLPDLLGYPSLDVSYTQSAAAAVAKVDAGAAVAALLVNPVPVADVFRTALRGKRMPEKSTYFYPKLRSGLVMRSLDL
jgi:uncharacterized protein (DUF1015 family)